MTILGYPKTLAWANFGWPKASVPTTYGGTHVDCHIETDINATYSTTFDSASGQNILKNVKVTVKINSLRSWVLKGVPTSADQAAILKHEQGHYNIAGITATDIENALTNLQNSTVKDLLNDAKTEVSDWTAAGQTEEDTYDGSVADGGTDHGNDITQQSAWNSKIAAASSLNDLP